MNLTTTISSRDFFTTRFAILYAFLSITCFFGGALNAQTFDKTKDILIAQFDNKPDCDDLHAQAALGSILLHPDGQGINYYAAMGTYGRQTSGPFFNSSTLFNMAFGAENTNWTNADADRSNSVIRIHDKVKPILLAGGKAWVMEAGQSDVTLLWLNALLSSGVPAATIKNNVIVVQHSQWNEGQASIGVLNDVKLKSTYTPVDDGNEPSGTGIDRGADTPDYKLAEVIYMSEALSASNPNRSANALWTEARRIENALPTGTGYIKHGANVDFSDGVEAWYILGLGDNASTVRKFWDRYVVNSSITVPVTGVTLSGCPASLLNVGSTVQLTAAVLPANASSQSISWNSSNPAIATVSNTGLITAVGAGSATIVVTTVDGGFTASCIITVTIPNDETIPWIEPFTLANNTISDVAPTSWTAANLKVVSNEIAFNNVGADGVFTTGAIDISSGAVTVSVKVRGGSGLDLGQDFLKLYKKVDGGAEVLIAVADGPQATATWTADITNGSRLVLVLRAHVTSTAEYYYFDDINVTSVAPVPNYTLTTFATVGGTVTPGGIYASGATASLIATPNSGYKFTSWSGDLTSVANPESIAMNTNKNVTANFEIDTTPSPFVTALTNWVSGTNNPKLDGSNRMMVVMVSGESTATFMANSATYGGVAMTRITDKAITSGSTTYSAIFILNEVGVTAATSGTINVVWSATPSSGSNIYSVLLANVDQTALPAAALNGIASATTIATSSALAASTGDMIVMCGATEKNNIITFNNSFTKKNESNSSWGDGVTGMKMGADVNETPSFTQSATGRMTICAIVAKKATPLISAKTVPATTSKNRSINLNKNSIRTYPNPVSNILNVDFGDTEINKQIKLFNVFGQLVYSTKTTSTNVQIDVQSLNLKGFVVVQVIEGASVVNHKVLVK